MSIGWHEDTQDAREEIAQAIARVQQGQGVLILTDMFGGTPSNLAMTFLGQQDVEVITGVNLPMLIKLAGLTEQARPARRRARDARTRPERDLGGVGSAARREGLTMTQCVGADVPIDGHMTDRRLRRR